MAIEKWISWEEDPLKVHFLFVCYTPHHFVESFLKDIRIAGRRKRGMKEEGEGRGRGRERERRGERRERERENKKAYQIRSFLPEGSECSLIFFSNLEVSDPVLPPWVLIL
jgi:hypothetical protein